jgi:hypothetical protein
LCSTLHQSQGCRYIYIVIAREKISTSTITQCDVVVPNEEISECPNTDGGVIVAGMGARERPNADSRVAATVTTEPRAEPDSRIRDAGGVVMERT